MRHYVIHGDFIGSDKAKTLAKYNCGIAMQPFIGVMIADFEPTVVGDVAPDARIGHGDPAILFLILNIIGLGMGPWTIGVASDMLEPSLGRESLRYAMLYILPVVMIWSVCHFLLAARTLREDLAAAPQ